MQLECEEMEKVELNVTRNIVLFGLIAVFSTFMKVETGHMKVLFVFKNILRLY